MLGRAALGANLHFRIEEKMNKHWLLAIGIFSSSIYAEQYLCPTNMQYVYTGDTISGVISTCGKPDQQVDEKSKDSQGSNIVWYYQMGTSNNMGVNKNGFSFSADQLNPTGNGITLNNNGLTVSTGAMAPLNLGVIFNNGTVSTIQQRQNDNSGQEMQSYNCANRSIQVGSSMSQVSAACGLPVMQKANTQPQTSADNTQAVEEGTTLLVYKPQSYLPAQTFVFVGGLLVSQR